MTILSNEQNFNRKFYLKFNLFYNNITCVNWTLVKCSVAVLTVPDT
jgi:hypothetical protein